MSGNNVEEKVNHASNSKGISLPMTRVKLIMKSSPDVSSINQEALLLTTKATELFVQHLALSSFNNGSGKDQTLLYSDLANTVEEKETFQFLTGKNSLTEPSLLLCIDFYKINSLFMRCTMQRTLE
uniref:Chromatin accessibility complex protein 1 n=1 Tax=Salmo trutta TaxID=8032 RepID=A0A674D9M6_SALTR